MGQTAAKLKGKILDTDSTVEQCGTVVDIPDDILWEILTRVPVKDIIGSCVRVCKQWHDVIESKPFWKHRCVVKHKYSRELTLILAEEDFKKLYFHSPYQTNLILNPKAEMGLNHWQVISNRGNGWKIEEPTGCDPIENYTHNIHTRGVRCWVTSYGDCSKRQTIDLINRGCSAHVLDELRPDICISEWYAGRFDCSMSYTLHVQLLRNKDDTNPIKEWTHEVSEPAGRSWFKAEHRFCGYEPGVRFICYEHTGVDGQFWAGWYGAKMTLSTVTLDFNHSTSMENTSDS